MVLSAEWSTIKSPIVGLTTRTRTELLLSPLYLGMWVVRPVTQSLMRRGGVKGIIAERGKERPLCGLRSSRVCHCCHMHARKRLTLLRADPTFGSDIASWF